MGVLEKFDDIPRKSTYRGDNDANLSFPPLYSAPETNPSSGNTSETASLSDLPVEEHSKVTDDGRFDISLNSRFSRALSKAYPRIAREEAPPPRYSQAVPTWDIPLNIVIQVVGSRGDVQPFVALGNELQKYGHRVRLATHPVFETFVRHSGLEFFSIGGDPSELMAYMVKNPGLIPNMQSFRAGEIQRKREMISEMLGGCWSSCISPDAKSNVPFVADAIIANPPSFAHVHCAQALGIPVHLMFTMPWSSTRAFPHPLANIRDSKVNAEMANFLSYGVVDWMTWRGLGDIINKWRRSIGLEEVADTVGPFLNSIIKVPFTYCWSPALVAKPFDWPGHIDVCGFFFREAPKYSPPKDLMDWLDAGSKPIYIGFGSIVVADPRVLTEMLLEALEYTGVRAIISRGWSKIGGPENTDKIYYLDDCPHEWLFQQVAAVIHHGGAGTTACGLLNACPTFIVPFFGDQPFWGSMVASAGAGPSPVGQKFLNSKVLIEAIAFLLRPETKEAASVMSAKMKTENGVRTAVESFHRNLPRQRLACDLIPQSPASWICSKGESKLRISKLAAEILVEYHKVDQKDLKQYASHSIDTSNKRWDPITGSASASLGAGTDMVTSAGGIFLEPYNKYQQERKAATLAGELKIQDKGKMVAAMGGASVLSMGKLIGGFYKAVIVDIPLATAEGLQAVPSLLGDEEAKDFGPVTDWKSGLTVAGKNFAYGFTGFSDLIVKPYQGGKKDGAVGALKGVGLGLSNMSTKFVAGAVGITAFSGQGICKSMYAATHGKTRKIVARAKWEEGEYLAGRPGVDEAFTTGVCEAFERAVAQKIRYA